MMSLKDSINESKSENIISIFKDGTDSLMSMIAKRLEHYDANRGKHSREPMFLCNFNKASMTWCTIDTLKIDIGDQDEEMEPITNYTMFDGFLTEYLSNENTNNDQYILGLFIDRMFIPITNEQTFNIIWTKLNKN